jgi:hypothetical protein
MVHEKLLVDDVSSARAAVKLKKERNDGAFILVLAVSVGAQSKAVVVQGTPEGVVAGNPSEEFVVGVVAGTGKEFDVHGVNEEEMRERGVDELESLFAPGKEPRVLGV